MNAHAMVQHSLWHQRTGAGRQPVCPICGNVAQFILNDMYDASWICYLGHPIIVPTFKQDPPCPFKELHV